MIKSIPFFSLKRQWTALKESILPQIELFLDEQSFIGGPLVASFETTLSHYLNGMHVISCNSGTDALWLALKALELKENDIVLTTPFSFIASSSEIIAHKAHPVFIDIESASFQISPQLMKQWLEKNAKIQNGKAVHKTTGFPIVGIIAVNLFGQCAEHDRLRAIADEWKLWIVEDGAQSLGARYKSQKATTFGDIGTLSFYPTKNVGAFGDAGAVCTHNEELAHRLRALRNHGRHDKYSYKEYGINSRLDAIQALVLLKKLELCDAFNEKRRKIAAHYTEQLGHLKPRLRLPQEGSFHYHIFHQYSLRISDRETFIAHLQEKGIGSAVFYPQSLTSLSFLQTHPDLHTSCPVTDEVCSTIVSLPIWPELENEEINYICDTIKKLFPSSTTHTNKQSMAQQ